jgi:hypothetical protein
VGLPDPRPEVVINVAREIGTLLSHLDPTPGPSELLVVYTAILIRLCKDHGIDREYLFSWVQKNYEGYSITHEEKLRQQN